MAFSSGVFTSTSGTVNGDGIFVGNKANTAAQLAYEKKMLYGNGISLDPTSAFYVMPKTGLTCTVGAGWGIMEGYWFRESADYDITMTSSVSEQTLYIGVRLDAATGEYTDSHVVARTTFVSATDRVFAVIVIPANAVTLTTAMITDTRYSTTYCGTVNAQRTALADLQAEYTEKLKVLESTGIPDHASTHAPGAADELTDYISTFSMISKGGVFTGGAVTAQGIPNQTVAVSAGSVLTPQGRRYAFDAIAALSADAANGSNPRIDIVYVASTGVVTYLAGTAAGSPTQPATPTNGVLLASITRATNDNTIATSDITQKTTYIAPRITGQEWTPTITSQVGTLTTKSVVNAHYDILGTYCRINVTILVTTKGTGAGALIITLPVAGSAAAIVAGREIAITGKQVQGTVNASAMTILNYDNTDPLVSGGTYTLTGFYQIA